MTTILSIKSLVVEESKAKPFRRTWPSSEAVDVLKEAGQVETGNSNGQDVNQKHHRSRHPQQAGYSPPAQLSLSIPTVDLSAANSIHPSPLPLCGVGGVYMYPVSLCLCASVCTGQSLSLFTPRRQALTEPET